MNQKLTCIIVDDEPLAVSLLTSFVERTPDVTLLASFTDSVEAVNAIRQLQPDLLLLDIQMPDLSGMELARMLPPSTRVVFTTAFKEYAFESYEVSALDFLLKPIRYNKFVAAIEKARQWFAATKPAAAAPSDAKAALPATLFLRVDGEYRQIAVAQILYVSGMKDYVMFWMEGERKPLITHLTMKTVEEMLPPPLFMRVHRSYIVALNKIRKVDRNNCIYIGEEVIHVTDAYLDIFQAYLREGLRN